MIVPFNSSGCIASKSIIGSILEPRREARVGSAAEPPNTASIPVAVDVAGRIFCCRLILILLDGGLKRR